MSRRAASVAVFATVLAGQATMAGTQPAQLNTIKDVFERLYSCWEPPLRVDPKTNASVIVTFRRDGSIFGSPKIIYESAGASDRDRLLFRVAIMKALERCTPLPFSDSLGGAVAGRPFALRLGSGKYKPQNKERNAWLTQKTL